MSSLPRPASEPSPPTAEGRTAGRGGLALAGAKVYFLVLGLVQQIALTWILRDSYGGLRGALSPASITYNPLVSAGVQGLSHAVSREDSTQSQVRPALRVHATLALATSLAFLGLAPWLGSWLGSPYLVPSFRILAVVVLCNGLYAPLVGVLNGRRRFLWQAGLDAFAATFRTLGLVVGAWYCAHLGTELAVAGASGGFAAATIATVVLAWLLARRSAPATTAAAARGAWKAQVKFLLPVLCGQIVLNLLLQADTNTLRAFATRAALGAGLDATAADPLVGAYSAAQLFAFLPYQLLIALTFILFPMLARAHALDDTAQVTRLVRHGTRVSALLVGLVVSVSASLPTHLMRLIFPHEFAAIAGDGMRWLCLGLGAFALFGVFATILNSLGRQWLGLGVVCLALVGVVLANMGWVSGTPFGPELMRRTALSTSTAVLCAAVLAGLSLRLCAGRCLPYATLCRVCLAIGVCVTSTLALPPLGQALTLVASGGVALSYLLILGLTRELRREDLALLLSLRR